MAEIIINGLVYNRQLPPAIADSDFAIGRASDGSWEKKTLAETRNILFSIVEVEAPSSITMDALNVYGKRHINYAQNANAILTFNAGAVGQYGEISMVTTVAKYYRLTPPAGAYFLLDGAALAVNQAVQVASAAEGQRIDWDTAKAGAAEWRIRLWTVSGPWAGV
jgi:hypothetical protein